MNWFVGDVSCNAETLQETEMGGRVILISPKYLFGRFCTRQFCFCSVNTHYEWRCLSLNQDIKQSTDGERFGKEAHFEFVRANAIYKSAIQLLQFSVDCTKIRNDDVERSRVPETSNDLSLRKMHHYRSNPTDPDEVMSPAKFHNPSYSNLHIILYVVCIHTIHPVQIRTYVRM